MSVVLYRKNKSGEIEQGMFPPEQVPHNLESLRHDGWVIDPWELLPGEPIIDFTGDIDDGMWKEPTLEELREKAKEAGFENWKTARTKTLKKVLGL